jgi:DNA repair protein radc
MDDSDKPDKSPPHFHGHRERLRARFLSSGAQSLPDYELLELILCRTNSRKNVKPLAKELIDYFDSFSEVLGAPLARLKEIKGIGNTTALDLKLVEAAAQRFVGGAVSRKQVLSSLDDVITHCRASMAFSEREQVRILFLDKSNALIADEVQQTGTVDHTPIYSREVIRRSLELSATALILVHNHPSGNTDPSEADIRMTRKIIAIAAPLGIAVHDHLIIGRHGHTSMRGMGIL